MTRVLKNCPSCGEGMRSSAEMAAHRCPLEYWDVGEEILGAAAKAELEARRKIQPTKEKLQADTRSAAEQLHEFWDGEVDVVVVMVPKGTLNVSYCTDIEGTDRQRAVFELLLQSVGRVSRMRRGEMLVE